MTTKTDTRFRLGTPQVSGTLAVYPVFGPAPRLLYRSLSQAVKHGAFISEIDEHGHVNEVRMCNASDQPALLYEGEVIAGARQTRTIDQPVLVPAGVELKVPVSCIERGRWDDRQRAERFTVAGQAADPGLRRTKRASANRRSAAGEEGRPDQIEVWQEVEVRLQAHAAASPSRALTALFDAHRPALAELKEPISALDGQLGAVAEIAGRPVALDLVSRPEVFADLLPRLADGYALEAPGRSGSVTPPRAPANDRGAEDFLQFVLGSRGRWVPTPGMGDAFVPTQRRIAGCGLRADRELVALSAFPVTPSCVVASES